MRTILTLLFLPCLDALFCDGCQLCKGCDMGYISYRVYCWVNGQRSPDSCIETCLLASANDQHSVYLVNCNAPERVLQIQHQINGSIYNVSWSLSKDVYWNVAGSLELLHMHPYKLETYLCPTVDCTEQVIATIGAAPQMPSSFFYLTMLMLFAI